MEQSNRTRPTTALFVSAIVAVGAFSAFGHPTSNDIAWPAYVAGRMLDGARLNRDVIEVNPPLIVYFAVLNEMIARAVGAWHGTVHRAVTLMIAVMSLTVTARLWQGTPRAWPAPVPEVLFMLLAFLTVAAPGMQFGQREHLTVLLILPYASVVALLMLGVHVTRRADLVAGAMAGLGLVMKPYFPLAWVLLEGLLVVRRAPSTLLRPGHIALLAIFMVYGLLVIAVGRDYLVVLQMAIETYGGFYPTTFKNLLLSPGTALVIAGILFALGTPPSRSGGAIRRVLGILIAVFFLAVMLQRKGWTYHWYPVWTFGALLVAVVAADLAAGYLTNRVSRRGTESRLRTGTGRTVRSVGTILIVAAAVLGFRGQRYWWHFMTTDAYLLPDMIRIVDEHANGRPIAALTSTIQVGFPLVNYTGVEWALRFPCLWPLAGSYPRNNSRRYHDPRNMSPTERFMFDAVIDDLAAGRPSLIFVDTRPPARWLSGFDYVEYFSQDARFRSFWSEYELLETVGSLLVYRRTRIARVPEKPLGKGLNTPASL